MCNVSLSLRRPVGPGPEHALTQLAYRLRALAAGRGDNSLFFLARSLPWRVDAANLPLAVRSSEDARLVMEFFSLRTERVCAMKGCENVSRGFHEIMKHQLRDHNRNCHAVCLYSDCLAPFDKKSNALRHYITQHEQRPAKRRRVRYEGNYFTEIRPGFGHAQTIRPDEDMVRCAEALVQLRYSPVCGNYTHLVKEEIASSSEGGRSGDADGGAKDDDHDGCHGDW